MGYTTRLLKRRRAKLKKRKRGPVVSPAAKRLIEQYSVLPEEITPTGNNGNTTKADVERAIAARSLNKPYEEEE